MSVRQMNTANILYQNFSKREIKMCVDTDFYKYNYERLTEERKGRVKKIQSNNMNTAHMMPLSD